MSLTASPMASLVEGFKSLKVDKLLITHQHFNLSTFKQKQAKLAFTMAEILLSLTIIGVVAAITLPSLTGNINERTWNTQRKALYSRFSQAIALMPALNGYGSTVDNAAETFITSGLAKVLKINNICASDFKNCGIVTSYTNFVNSKTTIPTDLFSLNSFFESASYLSQSYSAENTNAVAFETQNGESIIAYYNPKCVTTYLNTEAKDAWGNNFGFIQKNMCVNFVYDLNGLKGPNTMGKDMGFITAFNAADSVVVAPVPLMKDANNGENVLYSTLFSACKNEDPETRLPNIDELDAMFINMNSVGLTNAAYWSSSVLSTTRMWGIQAARGLRDTHYRGDTSPLKLRCVKR